MKIIDEEKRNDIFSLIESYLKDDIVTLRPLSLSAREDIVEGFCEIEIDLLENTQRKTITNAGQGLVEGIFDSLMDHYVVRYPSLGTIEFTGFDINTKFGNKTGGMTSGADAKCEVVLSLSNASRNSMLFFGRSRSLSSACSLAVFDAYQYYINAERCFLKIRGLIENARSRNRNDILSRLTYDITRIVSVTDYYKGLGMEKC